MQSLIKVLSEWTFTVYIWETRETEGLKRLLPWTAVLRDWNGYCLGLQYWETETVIALDCSTQDGEFTPKPTSVGKWRPPR